MITSTSRYGILILMSIMQWKKRWEVGNQRWYHKILQSVSFRRGTQLQIWSQGSRTSLNSVMEQPYIKECKPLYSWLKASELLKVFFHPEKYCLKSSSVYSSWELILFFNKVQSPKSKAHPENINYLGNWQKLQKYLKRDVTFCCRQVCTCWALGLVSFGGVHTKRIKRTYNIVLRVFSCTCMYVNERKGRCKMLWSHKTGHKDELVHLAETLK